MITGRIFDKKIGRLDRTIKQDYSGAGITGIKRGGIVVTSGSLFYPAELIEKAKRNAEDYAWAKRSRDRIVEAAQPWMAFSDDELWDLMFGSTIRRSWMVWSNGRCPACKEGVPMYNWRIDGLRLPWKLKCPHCEELFPKNDFHAYYRSGLDEHGVFQHDLADRSLVFNTEHPDPGDPLHRFGVDDGEGFRDGGNTWWFVGTYLVYGQWKQVVHGGIRALAAAYAATGETGYAHRAGVLLDRVADLYTTFNFKDQAMMYEGPAHAGYVSTWHDACEEARELAQAYDQVRDALRVDEALAGFLSEKAAKYGIEASKASSEDVTRHIEAGILQDTVVNHDRIRSNYPRKEIALITIHSVLDWEGNREKVYGLIDEMMERATAVDGVTGEKGLAGYCSGVIQSLAQFLARFSRVDADFLRDMLKRHPKLGQTYRFHIDTWCLQQYYPQVGDTGSYAAKVDNYVGVSFTKDPGLEPSMYAFLLRLYRETGDAAYVQALFQANGNTVEELPRDLFADDPAAFQNEVQTVIDAHGTEIEQASVNKTEWRLAVLRSGRGDSRRAAWLDYDSGGPHGHADGMNLGLFAMGLDLMPDFGYPPVHYGGWSGPKFHWYVSTASHNTVVVDGKDQERPSDGESSLWADGQQFRAIRTNGPALYRIARYERTVVMVDVSEDSSYLLDVFRVVGGRDHAKFMHSHFGRISTRGLSLAPAADYGYETQMRNFMRDQDPALGWHVDWRVEDRFGYLEGNRNIHLRYTDLTDGAEVSTAEAWVALRGFGGNETARIPRVMVRRQSDADPLASTFVGVIEAYDGAPVISGVRRLNLGGANGGGSQVADVAVEIELADGRRDVILAADVENTGRDGGQMVQNARGIRTNAELCVVRQGNDGGVLSIAICSGKTVHVGDTTLDLKEETNFVEVRFDAGAPSIVAGDGVLQ